ncbi:MAG: beta-lactamase family protein [Acidimicrobiales bacterium]|nr:beta-lactamase family protein [Acidimicrobiales bacterium]
MLASVTEPAIDSDRLALADTFIEQRYLAPGLLPGFAWNVVHRGEIVHSASLGYERDAIFRIYSMTKAVTSVAMLMLIEQAKVRLADPVHKFLPEWKGLRVYDGGSSLAIATTGLRRPMIIQDLFTHTAGLTYGWMYANPVDAMYRDQGIGRRDQPLDEMCSRLADIPLLFPPGTRWQYSVATDVLGHLVELIADMPLDHYFRDKILQPLGMHDTAFHVDDARADRLVANHARALTSPFNVPPDAPSSGPKDMVMVDDNSPQSDYRRPPAMLSGGGGLTSTLADYSRFCQMVLNGGELDGVRVVGSRTMAFAGRNHLPGGADLASIGSGAQSETQNDGIGFGLGFSVVLDPAQAKVVSSPGTLAWGGAASTMYWIDPVEDLAVIGMTQLMPSWTYPLRDELRQLVYAALL